MFKINSAKTTSWVIAGLGAAASYYGLKRMHSDKEMGAGLLGFGAAHLALGLLDRMRPVIKSS